MSVSTFGDISIPFNHLGFTDVANVCALTREQIQELGIGSVKINLGITEEFIDKFTKLTTFVNGMQVNATKVNDYRSQLSRLNFVDLQGILMYNSSLIWGGNPTYFLALYKEIESRLLTDESLIGIARERILELLGEEFNLFD